jgi:gluconolactonase
VGGTGGGTTGGASGTSGTAGVATGGVAGTSGTAGATTGGVAGTGAGAGGSAGNVGGAGAGGATGGASGSAGAGGSGGGGAFTCPTGLTGSPLPANPAVTRVTGIPSQFGPNATSNLEGPVWIDGSLYASHIQEGVTNPPPSRILKITGTTEEEFLMTAGTNGLAVNAMGAIVGARHSTGDIATLNMTSKTFTPIAGMYMTARFSSPNDLAIRRDGNIYFSDPSFQAPQPAPQNQTRVYRISPAGMVSVVDANLGNPNGVTLSLDENTLFVATGGNLYRYAVMQDGTTGSPMMMNGVPGSDGMVIDCQGNLYLTDGNQRRVVVVSSTGMMIGAISMGFENNASPTNVAFGGTDRRRLFVTTRNNAGLYYVDLNHPGMPY